ncbi:MAG: RNA-guided endonuclease TnpB family protein [Ktedonobacteraceae bacterium]
MIRKKSKKRAQEQEPDGLKNTIQIRLYPTREQARMLREHCQEYIDCVNVIVQAHDADMLPKGFSTKDFTAPLPSAVKNQVIRDAGSVYHRSFELGRISILKKPFAQWNNQNWKLEMSETRSHKKGGLIGTLIIPMWDGTRTRQVKMACCGEMPVGEKGILRIKRKDEKWVADATTTLPEKEAEQSQIVMGVDTGIKVPAVAYIVGQSARFYGNGRQMRYKRRKFYARRKKLQHFKKKRSVKRTKNKESRWMKDVNHKISRKIVNHAHVQGVATIKVESLEGIREGTTRTSRGASAQKNNRAQNSWTFYQLTQFITYKAARLGITVEMVDPAHTSQECPACKHRNKADDRAYECRDCGWKGHRDMVGAINISRRTGLDGHSQGAMGA